MNTHKAVSGFVAASAAVVLAFGLSACQTADAQPAPAQEPAQVSVDRGPVRPADRVEGMIQRRNAAADAYTGHDPAERMGIERWCNGESSIYAEERRAAARHCATLMHR